MNKTQLVLIETGEAPPSWRLDEGTRAIGRRGLRDAREALRAARRTQDPTADDVTARTPAA